MSDRNAPDEVLAQWDSMPARGQLPGVDTPYLLAAALREAIRQRDRLQDERDEWYRGCREAEAERDRYQIALQKIEQGSGGHHNWACADIARAPLQQSEQK